MDFAFDDTQQQVQQLARKILSEQVSADKLACYDEYQAERFDPALQQHLATAGLLGTAVDQAYGGMGFGFTELCLLIEEAGRAIAPLPLLPSLVSGALGLQRFGSEQQKARWLPGVADGSVVLSAALTEPLQADATRPDQTLAEADGEGYRVSGCKLQVPYANRAQRIVLGAHSPEGIVVLLLDPQAAGVDLTPQKVTTYEPQFALHLDQVQVSAADVLAGPVDGADVLRWIIERTQAAQCAMQLGISDHVLRMTAGYTAERKQFGVPIATFQAVGHRAANAFIDVNCLRLTTYQAVSLLQSEVPASTEVQIAKIWAGDVGHRVSYAAQHLHGGTGIDRDYPLWRYCLWLRHNEMTLGSSASQLAQLGDRIAAGEAYCQ